MLACRRGCRCRSCCIVRPDRLVRKVNSSSLLLIEDEPAIREVSRRTIDLPGCRVVTAKGGDAAGTQLLASEAVDVVLSEVLMPGLQGRALVDALRQVDPGLQVAFFSGYLVRRRAHAVGLDLGFDVLTKPVDSAQLAATLTRSLGARRAGSH
jgi:two-component system, cell cycle sensor histidine kinase and response regulator CckA